MRRETVLVVAVMVVGYSLYLGPAIALVDTVGAGATTPSVEEARNASRAASNATSSLKFRAVAEDVGLEYTYTDTYNGTRSIMTNAGAYAADYDDDGWEDVLLVGGERPVLFHNEGGTFERSGALPDLNWTEHAVRAALFFDYDGDGSEDLLLVGINATPVLLSNEGGEFERVDAGFERELAVPMTPTAGDFDGDGCLDLFVIQYGDWLRERPKGVRNYDVPADADNGNPNILYEGDCSTFEPATDAGITGTHWSLVTSFVDLNGDGHMDIHVANDFYYDVIYLNEGDGTFEKRRLGDRTNRNGMSSEIADVNHDGRPDLFVTNIWFPDWLKERLQNETTQDLRSEGNNLLVNQGGGRFTFESRGYGVNRGGWGWAAIMADLDNDMDRDLFHTTYRFPFERFGDLTTKKERFSLHINYPFYTYPRVMQQNETGFHPAPPYPDNAGFNETDGRGVARLDYDNDGDLDILLANSVSRVDGQYRLYENRVDRNNAIQVRAVGSEGGPAHGATVRVTAGGETQRRWVIPRADYLSQDSRLAHVGLGNNTRADVTVTWPDGSESTFENVAVGQRIVVGPDGIRRTVDLREEG